MDSIRAPARSAVSTELFDAPKVVTPVVSAVESPMIKDMTYAISPMYRKYSVEVLPDVWVWVGDSIAARQNLSC